MARTILINHVYSHKNRGDSAIVESMARFAEERYDNARIVLLSRYWKENESYYRQFGWESAPELWITPPSENKVHLLLSALWRLGRIILADTTSGPSALSSSPRRVWDLYKSADIILDAGGGSIYSSNKYVFYLDLYQHLFNLWFGVHHDVPVVIAPQSIGPLTRAHDRFFAMNVLGRLDDVLVREPVSARLLSKHGVSHQMTPDVAFLGSYIQTPTSTAREEARRFSRNQLNIGVTVLDWSWAADSRKNSQRRIESYLDKIANVLTSFKKDVRVWIFPQVTVGDGDTDLGVSRKLAKRCPSDVRATVVDDPFSASDLTFLYGQMDAFIGSRMHSCIFAITQGVPTIGLAYQPKTLGTYKLLGLDELAADIETFTVDWLRSRLDQITSELGHWRDRYASAAETARKDVSQTFSSTIQESIGGAS
jgi:colanic acid/amylovoran biosynthesis protein